MFRNTIERVVDWGDCDPAEIVFYPNFYRWFDSAARQLFEAAGLPWQELFARHDVVGLPLREANARFVSPARYGDRLQIASAVEAFREKAVVLRHTVSVGDRLVAEGTEVRAWARRHPEDPERLQAVTLPEEIRARLGGAN